MNNEYDRGPIAPTITHTSHTNVNMHTSLVETVKQQGMRGCQDMPTVIADVLPSGKRDLEVAPTRDIAR